MAKPQCLLFGKCAGCSLQNVEYKNQLEHKASMIMAAIGPNDVQVFSGAPYGYRNRMDFLFHPAGIGLREQNPSRIIHVDNCAIADSRINKMLAEANKFFNDNDAYSQQRNSGTFCSLILRAAKECTAVFVLNSASTRIADAVERINKFAELSSAGNIVVAFSKDGTRPEAEDAFAVKGEMVMHEEICGCTLQYSALGFFQNNTEVAQLMVQHAKGIIQRHSPAKAHLLDLYSGVGTFGVPLSHLFKHSTLVEEFAPSVECAKENLRLNNSNAEAFAMDADKIGRLKLNSPILVVADPPRSGFGQKALQALNELKPQVIVYVSCSPERLKADLAKLKGYRVASAAVFDMFPQTSHIEAVVELENIS